MRDGPEETFLHVAKVDIQIFPARRAPGFGHVLRKDLARADTFDEDRPEIANDRRDEIVRTERISRAHGSGFLAERTENAADNFRLAIEIDDALFDQPR